MSITQKDKVSVIGGAGFLGTSLCQLLLDQQVDFEIIDLRHSNRFPEKSKIGDIRDIQSLRNTVTGNIVVNLAAVHKDDIKNKSAYYQTNVAGAENLVNVCDEKKIEKIVFTSSVAVYGFALPGTDESGEINPYNDYGISKYEAEKRFKVWHRSNLDKSLFIIRPSVIFGEGNRGNVFNLFRQIASGKFVMVGDGENKKSMAYVENVVSFLMVCLKSDIKFGLFNYVDTPDLSMKELVGRVRLKIKQKEGVGVSIPKWFGLFLGKVADLVSLFTGKNLPVSSVRVKKFVSSSEFVSSARLLDGFTAPYKLIDALDITLEAEFVSPKSDMEIFNGE